jgi:ribonuclease BN (tRNA processing enzyme)
MLAINVPKILAYRWAEIGSPKPLWIVRQVSSTRVPPSRHLLASHTAAEDCGRIAAEAGVKTLVLSHFVPADDPQITEKMWADAARRHFGGRIIVGRDLMEI